MDQDPGAGPGIDAGQIESLPAAPLQKLLLVKDVVKELYLNANWIPTSTS